MAEEKKSGEIIPIQTKCIQNRSTNMISMAAVVEDSCAMAAITAGRTGPMIVVPVHGPKGQAAAAPTKDTGPMQSLIKQILMNDGYDYPSKIDCIYSTY